MPVGAVAGETEVPKNAVAVFGGVATDTSFVPSMVMPWTNELENIGIIAGAYDRRFADFDDLFGAGSLGGVGQHIAIEGEVGVSGRFGDESLGEIWTGLYFRYDGFPWNDFVYTTVAINTGLSLLTEKSDFETGRDENNKNEQLLHYMGPEITFADPDHPELEFLIRFHHRSGVFGLFNGVISGSTFITSGIRYRF